MPIRTYDSVRPLTPTDFLQYAFADLDGDDAIILQGESGQRVQFSRGEIGEVQRLLDHHPTRLRLSLVSARGFAFGFARYDDERGSFGIELEPTFFFSDPAKGYGVWLFQSPVKITSALGEDLIDHIGIDGVIEIPGYTRMTRDWELDSGAKYSVAEVLNATPAYGDFGGVSDEEAEAQHAACVVDDDRLPGCIAELGNGGVLGADRKSPRRFTRKKRMGKARRQQWGRI